MSDQRRNSELVEEPDVEFLSPEDYATHKRTTIAKLRRSYRSEKPLPIKVFAPVGMTMLEAIDAGAGFTDVRRLSPEQYAQYRDSFRRQKLHPKALRRSSRKNS